MRDGATGDLQDDRRAGAARLAFGLGLGLALAAGVALWASEGAAVFAESAFAALIACF